MKRWIFVIALVSCAVLVLGGSVAVAGPQAGRASGAGRAILTNPPEGLHLQFRFTVWEATAHRPAGGWNWVSVEETGQTSKLSVTHVNVGDGVAGYGMYSEAADIYYYVLVTDGGPLNGGAGDTMRSAIAADEAEMAAWVQALHVPDRTWTVESGNIGVR